jgi:hypothetical protein
MITADELRQVWNEASAGADQEEPTYIRWFERSWEFLVPTEDDDSPVLCRCRCCGSVCVTGLGPEGNVPDRNLGIHIPVTSPCGYCRPSVLPRSQTLRGVRERYRAGQPLGIGR